MLKDDSQQIFQQARQADPERILTELRVNRAGKKFSCPNPKHDDRNPSADFSGGDGKLWLCRSCGAGGDVIDLVKLVTGKSPLEAAHWINGNVQVKATPPARNGQPGKATRQAGETGFTSLDDVSRYYLKNLEPGMKETGRYFYSESQAVLRFELPGQKKTKTLSTLHRNEKGRWITNKGDKPWPIYPSINGKQPKAIIILEGEKTADAVNKLKTDFHAITTRSGYGSAKYADWQTMPEGLPVILWPDNDEDGQKYADNVMQCLEKAGKWPVKGLKRIQPPAHWPKGFDASDLIEQAGTDDEAVKQILKVIADAQPVDRQQEKTNADRLQEIGMKPATQIEVRPIDWIIRGHLARGETTLILGEAGSGKTKICTARAARLTRGEPILDMPVIGGPQRIAIISLEEDPGRTVRPTCEISKADLSRVLIYDPSETDRGIRSIKDLAEALEQMARAGVSYCLVDSLTALSSRLSLDLNKPGDAYQIAEGLNAVARRENLAVELIHHVSKAGGAQHSDHKKGAGSYAVTSSVRSVLRLEVDPQTGQRFFGVSPGKNGLGLDFEKVMTFTIEKSGDYATASLTGWHPETIDVIAAKIARARNQGESRTRGISIEAGDAIENFLQDRDGLAKISEIDKHLKTAGYTDWSIREAKALDRFNRFTTGGVEKIWYLTTLAEAKAREKLKSGQNRD